MRIDPVLNEASSSAVSSSPPAAGAVHKAHSIPVLQSLGCAVHCSLSPGHQGLRKTVSGKSPGHVKPAGFRFKVTTGFLSGGCLQSMGVCYTQCSLGREHTTPAFWVLSKASVPGNPEISTMSLKYHMIQSHLHNPKVEFASARVHWCPRQVLQFAMNPTACFPIDCVGTFRLHFCCFLSKEEDINHRRRSN